MATNMGFYNQDEWTSVGSFPATQFKHRNRWKFIIPDVSASGVSSLPPSKVSRLGFSFKEMQAEHLNETIFFPSKPEWKPITLTLYDIVKGTQNPIFTWLKRAYNPTPEMCSYWKPCLESESVKCAQCFLVEYDGCGVEVERWVFEHAWPQAVEFSDGDMSSGEVNVCDVTLRYDRAYIVTPSNSATLGFTGTLPSYTCSATPAPISIVPVISIVSFAMAMTEPIIYGLRRPEFIVVKN